MTGSGTDRADVMLTGPDHRRALVGAAQSHAAGRGRAPRGLDRRDRRRGWSLGWLTTSAVIVDIERGYAVFGSSGAIVVTRAHRPGAAPHAAP